MTPNEQGFGLVKVLLLLVLVWLIGFTGWFVYRSNKIANESFNRANNALQTVIYKYKGPNKTTTKQ